MLLLLLVSLVTLPLVFAVADTPRFVLQPRDTTAVRGETVILYCSVSNQDGVEIVWIKDGTVIIRGFNILVADPHRFSIGAPEGGAHNLIITGSQSEDSGSYRCVVTTGGAGLISDTADLRVLSPPTVEYPACTGAGSDEVAVGERVALACDVEGGNPKAQLFFNKGDVAVETVATETGIKYNWAVSEADESAEFTCIGNQRFWAEPRTCHLGPFHIVRGPPTLNLVPAETTIQGGNSVSFLCSAESAPRASYKWFVGGEEVDNDADGAARMTVLVIGGSSVLLVHDVGNVEKSLKIMCVVSSATGTVGANAVMHVEPVYTVITDAPPAEVSQSPKTDHAGPDATRRHTPVDTGDDNVNTGEPKIYEPTYLPFIVGGAAAGVVVLLVAIIIIVFVMQRGSASGSSTTRSTEKLAEGAPAESDVYFRSRFVGIARSWLFPVHRDTQKAMAASMASQPVQS